MSIIYSKSGFNRNTSRVVLQSPNSLAGGEFVPLSVLQGEGQLQHFLKFWRTDSDVSRMLRIDLAWCQSQAGIGTPILEAPWIDLPHLEARWLPSLRDFPRSINGSLELDETFVIPHQRSGDCHLMDIFIESKQFTRQELCELNYCRLYLRVVMLSDITTLDGSRIDPRVLRGERSRNGSSRDLPAMQANPGFRQWLLWRRALMLFGTSNGILTKPLGEWLLPTSELHCIWSAYAHKRYPFLFLRTRDGSWLQLAKDREGLFSNPSPVHNWQPNDSVIPTSVTPVVHNDFSCVSIPPPLASEEPTQPVSIPETFEEYVEQLPLWERVLLQDISLEFEPFEIIERLQSAPEDSEWHAVVVSDGAGKNHSMAYGLTLVDIHNTTLARCSGPAYGPESSHRAESYGQLAGSLLLYHLLYFCHACDYPWKLKWCSDNAGMLRRLQDRMTYDHPYPNSTLAPDWDVIEEIHQTRKRIPGAHIYEHVKGHQDSSAPYTTLDLEAQANVEADRLAGEYNLFHSEERPRVPRLPSTRAQLYLSGRCVTSHVRSAIRQAATYPALQRKIEERYNWSRRTCAYVDWSILPILCRRFQHRSTWVTKFVHDLLPTNAVRARYDPSICSDCLRCGAPNETFEHILQCPHPAQQSWRNEFMTAVRNRCDSMHTRESLKDAAMTCLFRYLSCQPIIIEDFHPSVRSLIKEQTDIGWYAFLRGHVSSLWSTLQQDYLVDTGQQSNTNTGNLWIANLVHTIWESLWEIWEVHNQEIHGFDARDRESKRKECLAYEIRYLHSRRPFVLSEDKDRFFLRDLGSFLAKNHSTVLANWLTTYRCIIEDSEQAACSAAVANTRPLTEYFRVVYTNPQAPIARRYNPRVHFIHDNTRVKKRRPPLLTAPVPITHFFSPIFAQPSDSSPPSVVYDVPGNPSRSLPGPSN